MSTNITSGDLTTLSAEISALERNPNAIAALKAMLSDWLQHMEAAAGGAPSGGATPLPQQSTSSPGQAGPGSAPPPPAPGGGSSLGNTSGSTPPAQQGSPPSAAPPADTQSQGSVDVSGTSKTITMSNTSDKDMVLYHTGGDGGATSAVATLKPGESVDVTVGNGTSGAFTKGDADGKFTPDSGRVEYSVTNDGKMSANLDSELGVDAMSLQAGSYNKSVGNAASNAPSSLKDASGRLLEPKTHPDVQAYLDSLSGYNQNSYTHSDTDGKTNVMEAAMLDVNKISASFS